MRLSKVNPIQKGNGSGSRYLSTLTIGWGIYIIISASFMRQVWEFLGKVIGDSNLRLLCILVSLLLGATILLYIIKYHFNIARLIANIIILTSGFLFAWRQPYFVEKMHVLEYGFLGWLAMRDLRRFPRINTAKRTLFSMLFVLIIGSLDEGFQKLLPYRVGEIRDVVTNLVSGTFGIILYLIK